QARPPRRPISIAVAGETTPSIAAAIIGSSSLYASTSHVMSTSSGSRVRRLGTMAMSSNPYARRPDLPIPISTSTCPPELRVVAQLHFAGRGEDTAAPPRARAPASGFPRSRSGLVVGQHVGWRGRRVVQVVGRVLHAIAEPGTAVGLGHLLLPAAHHRFDRRATGHDAQ